MNNVKFVLFSASIMLALAFTFSCSDDKDDGGGGGGGNSSDCPNSTVGNNTLTCGGQTYKTVKIGDQVWMAENLNYNVYGSRCYDDKSANCKLYGRLYDKETAKTVCPSGWHLPSKDEWNVLLKFVNPSCGTYECAGVGTKLKAISGWNDYEGISSNGTDDYGFSALPGGYGDYHRGNFEGFKSVGYLGCWWSSSSESGSLWLIDKKGLLSSYILDHSDADLFSVRCIKD